MRTQKLECPGIGRGTLSPAKHFSYKLKLTKGDIFRRQPTLGIITRLDRCKTVRPMQMGRQPRTRDRGSLSEVPGARSTATDLAASNPPRSALTTTVRAVRLGRGLGLHEYALPDLYYACITRFIGCTATPEDTAATTFADELRPISPSALQTRKAPGQSLKPALCPMRRQRPG